MMRQKNNMTKKTTYYCKNTIVRKYADNMLAYDLLAES
jgi:hypothetical protein